MRWQNLVLLLCITAAPMIANSPPSAAFSYFSGSSAAGVQQVFTFTYSDPDGASDIDAATAAFWSTMGTGCRVTYEFGYFWLANDNGTALYGPLAPNSGSLNNSYYTLTNPSVSNSGTQRTLTLPLTFTSASVGALSHYKYLSDWAGLNTGCVWDGSRTISNGNQLPTFVSSNLSGSSTVGAQQMFSFTHSDPNGASDIDSITAAFYTTLGIDPLSSPGRYLGLAWASQRVTAVRCLFQKRAPKSRRISTPK